MTGWLAGKRALIVGAGSGIGRATVDAFLNEDARVAVLEYDSGKCATLRQQLPDVPVIEGDGTTRTANDEAVQVAVDAFGGLDTLVNCVGGYFRFLPPYSGHPPPSESTRRSTKCFASTS